MSTNDLVDVEVVNNVTRLGPRRYLRQSNGCVRRKIAGDGADKQT